MTITCSINNEAFNAFSSKAGDTYYIPEMQMELFPRPKPKKSPFPPNNCRTGQVQSWEEYYEEQKNKKPLVRAEGLESHY